MVFFSKETDSTQIVPVDGADGAAGATSVMPGEPLAVSKPSSSTAPAVAWGNGDGAIDPALVQKPDEAGRAHRASKELQSKRLFEFTDSEAIKKDVRATLLRPDPYTVFDFYKKDGPWQYVAKHNLFENTTLGVIAANAIWMAVDTDWNKATSPSSADAIFQVVDQFFCVYFTGELLIRFMAFARKRDGLKDAWFMFDSALVALMVMETWVLAIIAEVSGDKGESPLGNTSILRLFRLLRLSRLLRMMRSLPELMILIKGMITAMKSVVYVMCLLAIILYVFGIAFTQLAIDKEVIRERYFQNVALSMYSLLIYGTFLDDLSQFCDDIRAESIPILVLLFLFICLSALTVMNMLIGVLCEVVSAVAETEKEMILTATVSEKMLGIVNDLDTNANGMISFVEFRRILEIPQALRALEEVGVDPAGVVDFAELMFFEDSDPNKPVELPFDTFMEMILDLRCSNTATVKDIKYMWRQIGPKMTHLTKDVDELKDRTHRIEHSVDAVLTEVKKLVNRQDTLVSPLL